MMVSQNPEQATEYCIDFGQNGNGRDWYEINDDVMGGRSRSQLSYTNESMIFSGHVSLENNGGFASVRSPRKKLDLSKYQYVTIVFRSDNKDRNFALRLNNNDRYYLPSYNKKFNAKSENWQQIKFNLRDFNETVMGKETGALISSNQLQNIIRIGIMLNDKKEGTFRLELRQITFT